MSLVSSWRTALRVARREAGRSKGRSSLVVAMIALPVLCLSFAAVSYDMFKLTGSERADRTMGTADARIHWPLHIAAEQDVNGEYGWPADRFAGVQKEPGADETRPGTEAELMAELPAGSRVLPVRTGVVELRTAAGVGHPNDISVDATSSLTDGYVEVIDGRVPTTATEVALTEQAATRVGAGIGGTVTSADGLRTYSVVGLIEFPSMLEETLLFAPFTEESPKGFQQQQLSWLVDTPAPITWAGVRELNKSGIVVASRDVLVYPPPADQVPNQYTDEVLPQELAIGVLVAGLALLEIVLLAGPAFAVSARRRQRQLALVAANGGTPAHVRRIVLADGVVLGVAGAVIGIVGGVAAAFGARPFIEELLAHSRAGAYRVFPTALLAIAALAVITGLLAALVPAFITARQNVVASLAGRRGVTRSRKRWIAVGLAMLGAGATVVVLGTFAGSAQVMLAGLVLGELGMVLCTPALVGLIARLGRVLPLAPRIALRDAARNRAAAAPAISAVMAAVAGSVAIGLYLDSNREMQLSSQEQMMPIGNATVYFFEGVDKNGQPVKAERAPVENAMRSTLPVADIRQASHVACAGAFDPERWCALEIQVAPQHACPFVDAVMGPGRVLTVEEQRTAKADPRCDERRLYPNGMTFVDDGTALPILTGASADDVAAATAVLRAGGVVVRDARYIDDGHATFAVLDVKGGKSGGDPRLNASKRSFPAYLLTTGVRDAATIVSPDALAQVGFTSTPGVLVASTTREPSSAEEEKFYAQLQNLSVGGSIERGPQVQIPAELWIIMAAAALITLGAAGIGTGLAAADGRADLSTLASVGASPRLRRGLSLSQSGVIAGLGSLLGAAAGLGAAVAVMVALNQRYVDVWPSPPPLPIAVPWLNLAAALLVVPFVAILGAGLLTRSRLPIERRL